MAVPTFLLIGAQKAGTTWLADLLDQHPEVFTPSRKELHHFDLHAEYEHGFDAYLAQFSAAGTAAAIGEATPNYLGVLSVPTGTQQRLETEGVTLADHPEVIADPAGAIHGVLPDLKLIVILRDPVARALSGWRHHIRRRRLSPRHSFRSGCGRHGILTMGFYHHHLSRWFELYDPSRFLILSFEDDVVGDPLATARRAYAHIGVDPDFVPARLTERSNERSSDLELHLRQVSPRLAQTLASVVPPIRRVNWPRIAPTDDELRFLAELYADDVTALEERLDRRFERWTMVAGR